MRGDDWTLLHHLVANCADGITLLRTERAGRKKAPDLTPRPGFEDGKQKRTFGGSGMSIAEFDAQFKRS